MKRRCFLVALLCMAVAAVYGSPVEIQAGKTDVKVEFYTPSIVHIVKSPTGHQYTKQSLLHPVDRSYRQVANWSSIYQTESGGHRQS